MMKPEKKPKARAKALVLPLKVTATKIKDKILQSNQNDTVLCLFTVKFILTKPQAKPVFLIDSIYL